MSARYVKGQGVIVVIQGKTAGQSVTIPDHMLISAIENHLKEVRQWLA